MKIQNLKKGIISLALTGSFILGVGAVSNADAQDWRRDRRQERREEWRERRAERIERQFERQELNRIRQLDHQRRLRYQYYGGNRLVGYYDRFGQFHAIGYYDRWGQFWRYQ